MISATARVSAHSDPMVRGERRSFTLPAAILCIGGTCLVSSHTLLSILAGVWLEVYVPTCNYSYNTNNVSNYLRRVVMHVAALCDPDDRIYEHAHEASVLYILTGECDIPGFTRTLSQRVNKGGYNLSPLIHVNGGNP